MVTPAHSDGAGRFLLVADKKTIGAVSRQRLPFFPDPPKRTEPRPIIKAFEKILPEKIGRALFDVSPPLGWKLEVALPAAIDDPMLLLCAALMTIDIRCW